MTRNELLKYCRYYKGEEDCPFKEGDVRGFFWFTERMYFRNAVTCELGIDRFLETRKNRVRHYIDTHPDETNIYTDPNVSIHTKAFASYVEDMSAKWRPMSRNLIFDY
ncbi:MAG: hypothetical protein LUC44_08560 [Prevotellaceae bacterium]|nr:hypothetical protein [Prevotellaceae bacterium]